ncbi:hypothetical protein ACFL40_04105, partial [candidate division KSB1 bacterium]
PTKIDSIITEPEEKDSVIKQKENKPVLTTQMEKEPDTMNLALKEPTIKQTEKQPITTNQIQKDPNAIYQNNNKVGDVAGIVEVNKDDKNVVRFRQISNTKGLNTKVPFIYRNAEYKIMRIKTMTKMLIDSNGMKYDVLGDVECLRIKYLIIIYGDKQ